MKAKDSLLFNNIITQNPILAGRVWFLLCCITYVNFRCLHLIEISLFFTYCAVFVIAYKHRA